MKTRIAQIFALVTILLLFTACQKDSLVDDISPDYTIDDSIEMRSSEAVEFELWQYVGVIHPDCPDVPEMVEHRTEGEYETSKTSGCYGTYGLTSDLGQGYMDEYGRFLSTLDLKFNPDKDQVDGTVTLKFVPDGDMLILKAMGKIIKKESIDGGITLTVQIMFARGTGRFAHVNFNGTLSIMEADLVFNSEAIDYNATILVQGAFGK